MYKHLLVPLDGSRLAETALTPALYLARGLQARVTLLHVAELRAPEEIHGERHLSGPEEAADYLKEASAVFGQELRVEFRIEREEDDGIAQSIVACAKAVAADLIVMCTHGRSGLRHMLMGSNAQQIISIGGIPVLQVRPPEGGAPAFACRSVLVPLDCRSEHEEGLETAKDLALALGAEICLLVVVPTLGTLSGEHAAAALLSPGATAALLDMKLRGARDYLDRLLGELKSRGFRVSGEIGRGDPVDTIEQVAGRTRADLIVFGTHRKAGTDAFWSGSVAPKVSNRSRVPVLLVPLA